MKSNNEHICVEHIYVTNDNVIIKDFDLIHGGYIIYKLVNTLDFGIELYIYKT